MPNDDCILRGDALKAVCENCSMHGDEGEPCSSRCEDYALVLKIPAADVEPKRKMGWWIPSDYVAVEHGECVHYPGEGITCSRCRYGFKGRFLWRRDYCPHCGSVMLPEPPKETDRDEQTSEDI